jgi:ribosomal protein S18 acetylase RimI-like enzyme
MEIRIAKAAAGDIPAILAMMREFAEYEQLSQFLDVTEERLFAAMFGPEAFVEGLMALDGSAPVGYAVFYPYFASFRGQRGLYLEDIYIRDEYRRHNLGETMLREIARLARDRGFERMDFQVLETNTPAIRFYEKHGAVRDDTERHFKFTDEAFRRLASGDRQKRERE